MQSAERSYLLLWIGLMIPTRENGKKVLTMTDFYFAVGSDPCDVFVVVGDQWVPYKRCATEEAAQALVTGQNESRRYEDA